MAKRPDHIIPLLEEHYAAIGRVAAEWAALEGYISAAIGILLACRWRSARLITANIAETAQEDLLKALARLEWGEDDPVTKALVTLLDGLGKERQDGKERLPPLRISRNLVIHGSWVLPEDAENPFVVSYKARGRYRHHVQPYSAKEIAAIADAISETTGSLMELLQEPLEAFHFRRRPSQL